MRRKIVTLSLVIAGLTIGLFGVPLAVGLAQFAFTEEQASLQRLADFTARSAQPELIHDEVPSSIPDTDDGRLLGVYDGQGRRLLGDGPPRGDDAVERALNERAVQDGSGSDLLAAVPVTDGHGVHGVVRAMAPASAVYERIAPAWLGMVALAGLVLVAVWVVARRQAGRLAAPLERLAVSAQRLGEGDFTVRAAAAGLPEIDSVGDALNGTAGRLDDLLARERSFSAEASHQLRTPLSGLRLRLEAALDQPDRNPRDAIRDGINEADRLERTIDELLVLAREDTSTTREPIDVPTMLAEIETEWRDRLPSHRGLECHIPPDLPQSPVSAAATRQVLGVLLDNAELHGAGTIRLSARDLNDAVAVDVSDEGPGPRPGALAADERECHVRPHGMGLAIARRLAEAEGGRLVLSRSSPPTFTFLIPAERFGAPVA